MQFALIVQLSIAMLARELAGGLPIGALWGAVIALCGPLVSFALGSMVAARAMHGMDRRDPDAAQRAFVFTVRAGWIGALFIAVAACSALPTALPAPFGGAVVAIYLLSCGIASMLAAHWTAYPIEARVRESSTIRMLDSARSLHPIPTRGAYVFAQARAGLIPIIAPLIVPIAFGEVAAAIAREHFPGHETAIQFGGGLAGVLALFLAVPLIIPPLLGLTRLPAGELRDDLEELAKGAGIGVREIWVWPTDGLVANAAVMGVFPRLRCVMLSDALVEGLPRQQVLAVMAHELGHVAHRHLAGMLPVILSCWWIGSLVGDPVAQGFYESLVRREGIDLAAAYAEPIALARDLAIAVFGLFAFGFVSRRFERQADTYAVRLLSEREQSADATPAAVGAMTGALSMVAFLNHVPVERPSWRHGSIAWRQAYLRSLAGQPHGRLPIDSLVRTLCVLALVAVLAMLVSAAVLRAGA
ncbi:MAG: M48 family metallopeptidase [bacterium]